MTNAEITIYGEPVNSAKFGRFTIDPENYYQELVADPELVVRQYSLPFAADNKVAEGYVIEDFRSQASTVKNLQSSYDIFSVNPVLLYESIGRGGIQAYQATTKIHGQYFTHEYLKKEHHGAWQLNAIPEAITIKAFDGILRYYEDVTDDIVGDYQADIRLGNLIYGRPQGDYKDHIYLFDLGLLHFAKKYVDGFSGVIFTVNSTRGGNLTNDLRAMQSIYGKNFDDFQQRLSDLAIRAQAKQEAYTALSQNERNNKYRG